MTGGYQRIVSFVPFAPFNPPVKKPNEVYVIMFDTYQMVRILVPGILKGSTGILRLISSFLYHPSSDHIQWVMVHTPSSYFSDEKRWKNEESVCFWQYIISRSSRTYTSIQTCIDGYESVPDTLMYMYPPPNIVHSHQSLSYKPTLFVPPYIYTNRHGHIGSVEHLRTQWSSNIVSWYGIVYRGYMMNYIPKFFSRMLSNVSIAIVTYTYRFPLWKRLSGSGNIKVAETIHENPTSGQITLFSINMFYQYTQGNSDTRQWKNIILDCEPRTHTFLHSTGEDILTGTLDPLLFAVNSRFIDRESIVIFSDRRYSMRESDVINYLYLLRVQYRNTVLFSDVRRFGSFSIPRRMTIDLSEMLFSERRVITCANSRWKKPDSL